MQNVSYEVPKTGDAKPAHPPPSTRALDYSAYNAKLPSPRQDLHAASMASSHRTKEGGGDSILHLTEQTHFCHRHGKAHAYPHFSALHASELSKDESLHVFSEVMSNVLENQVTKKAYCMVNG